MTDPNTSDPNASAGEGDKKATTPEFKVPEQYANEPWAKSIKDQDGLWKHLAGAEKLIGKKGIIPPSENSSPEEIARYRKDMGIPETPEEYEFKNIDPLKDRERNPVVDNGIKKILHKHGVKKEVGEAIIRESEELLYKDAQPKLEAQTKIEREFLSMVDETFGKEKDKVMNQFKDVMKNSLPDPALAAKLDELSNDQLKILMTFSKGIHDKYVGEHKIQTGGKSITDTVDLKSEFQGLSEAKLKLKIDNTIPNHIKSEKMIAINKKMMEIGAKAKDKGLDLFS